MRQRNGQSIENPYIQYMYSYPHKTLYGELPFIELADYMQELSGGQNSLYFHIPFCQYKCGYCNLFSLAGQPESLMEGYLDAVERQAEQWAPLLPRDAVFDDLTLGGGTPLLLPEEMLRRIFRIARDYFGMDCQNRPVIVETSPNQTTEEKCALLKEEGVNRVSIGIQSFVPEELKALCRSHSANQGEHAVEIIRKADFDCVNIDLIYGIPGQTFRSLTYSLRRALSFAPEELFVYPLYIKPETGLARRHASVSEDCFEMGRFVRRFLQGQGYRAMSMRRFVKEIKCIHSTGDPEKGEEPGISLCGFGNTLSLGCGGRSYLGNLHFCTPYAVRQEACAEVLQAFLGEHDYCHPRHGYLLSQEEQMRRYAIRHILYGKGIDREDYRRHFQGTPEEDFPCLEKWISEGWAVGKEESLSLTEEGFLLSDYLGPQLTAFF